MLNLINASAIILKPKQSFFTWLTSNEISKQLPAETLETLNSLTLDVMRVNSTVIAIPFIKKNLLEEANQFIEAHSDKIIDAELSRWGIAKAAIPASSPRELLKTWFDVSYHARIFTIA